MLDILIEVDRICRQEKIDYWMDAGTLLGAVRHQGFIPWDDDLDICILKKDYKRFKKAMNRHLSDCFVYQDWTTDPHHFEMSPRIRDKHSFIDIPIERLQKHRGLFLDVVLLERIPSMAVQHLVYLIYGRVSREMHNYGDTAYTSIAKRTFAKTAAYILFPFVWTLLEALRAYASIAKCDLIGRYYAGFKNPRYLSNIFPLTEIAFEGYLFFAPGNYDSYLKDMFNDYSKLPPENQREGHTFHLEIYPIPQYSD